MNESKSIQNRYEFVYFFDVENGNPNGDPDNGNIPRIDPETNHGLITDVCLKRKIRNFVQLTNDGALGMDIYVKEKAVLTSQRKPAYKAVEGQQGDRIERAKKWMCANFFDVRTFGAVMSAKENNCGQVRGPVQFSFARSIDPVIPVEIGITRMAVETEKESKDQDGGNRTMGRKYIIPYALYRVEGYVSAFLADGEKGTGFSEEDLSHLWQALINMFDHDHSAARGKMSARRLIAFKHDSRLGSAPAHTLFDLITVKRAGDGTLPVRKYTDYKIEVDKVAKPEKIEILELL